MTRKIAAIAGGVVLGLIIAFARAGAFSNTQLEPG